MAGRIRDEDIALVRERVPIDDVVREVVTLRSAGGGSLKGLCPFHEERSPSFHVTPSRGYYYCFGCGEGGDVITFVMKTEQLTFAESVEKLAARAGMQLHYEEGSATPGRQQGQRTRLVEANKAAYEFYREALATPPASIGREFLTSRGFDGSSAEHFGVGFAPAGWDNLTSHLRGRGFTDAELLAAGLVSQGQRGVYDRFRERLVWPIRDVASDVVGFGARKLTDRDDGPKYLNTPETALYRKGQVLYGVDLAKKDIARRRQAVLVEGYTDVMACHLAGVTTAVATCGTSFGSDHIKVLRRLLMDQDEFRGEVIFTFDGDEAGRKAALRAFADDQRFVAQTFVAVEPAGLDPCDLRLQSGDEAMRELIARRVPMFEFAIRSALADHDLETPEGRVAGLAAAAPLVAQIRDRSLRPEYTRSLAGWLGMPVEAVSEAVNRRGHSAVNLAPQSNEPAPPTTGRPRTSRDNRDPAMQVQRESLKLVLQAPTIVGLGYEVVETDAYTDPGYQSVHEAITKAGGVASGLTGEKWVTAVRDASPDDVTRTEATELAVEPLFATDEVDPRYAEAVIARLRETVSTRRVESLKSRLQRINPIENADEYNSVFGDLLAEEQLRRALRERAIGGL
jgi:DNA primase